MSDTNDVAIVLGYAFGVIGWVAGLGVFNDLGRLMLGKPMPEEPRLLGLEEPGLGKYFRYTLDHKVVGIQYLYGMIGYFLTGGLFAMAIRSELLSPTYHLIGPEQYLMVVSEHGTMMMMMMSSVILGPFGQYFGPLLIGSKRVAFPRLEALGFWLTPAAYIVLLSAVVMGGFPTGWTGYEPLATQATQGMDAYFFAFGLMGISMILAGFNMIVTVINYRAPGMRWSRLPMFVWSMFTVRSCRCWPSRCWSARALWPRRSDLPDRVLHQPARRQQLPVPGPVLVLRPSRGVHPGLARLRHHLRSDVGVLPQAAVRLQDRRGRHARRGHPVLLRLAAPPVHSGINPTCGRCSCSPPS